MRLRDCHKNEFYEFILEINVLPGSPALEACRMNNQSQQLPALILRGSTLGERKAKLFAAKIEEEEANCRSVFHHHHDSYDVEIEAGLQGFLCLRR